VFHGALSQGTGRSRRKDLGSGMHFQEALRLHETSPQFPIILSSVCWSRTQFLHLGSGGQLSFGGLGSGCWAICGYPGLPAFACPGWHSCHPGLLGRAPEGIFHLLACCLLCGLEPGPGKVFWDTSHKHCQPFFSSMT
jgi:hypothetical protein